ncbi:MAG: phage portal protein, partial [Alphaproteobacteria bacterium]
WTDAQRLFIETLARDGEVLVRFVNGYRNLERFAIEFVESDILDEELNAKAQNGNRIRMGVEVDREWPASPAPHCPVL